MISVSRDLGLAFMPANCIPSLIKNQLASAKTARQCCPQRGGPRIDDSGELLNDNSLIVQNAFAALGRKIDSYFTSNCRVTETAEPAFSPYPSAPISSA
jgi:hypothetical protein